MTQYGIFKPCVFPDHDDPGHTCDGMAQLMDECSEPLRFPAYLDALHFIENFVELYGDTDITIAPIEVKDRMTHTQGQWQLHSPTQGDPKTGDGTYCITGSHGGVIAKIIPEDSPETPANATLISASPELLAALRALVISIENVDFSPLDGVYDQIPWAQAEAAIAKATEEVS
jgi:hypothetical protein